MADPASRFRRLPPPRLSPRVQQLQMPTPTQAPPRRREAPDLFEHFGVALDPDPSQPTPLVTATPCPGCGWWIRAHPPEPGCPICARPCSQESS